MPRCEQPPKLARLTAVMNAAESDGGASKSSIQSAAVAQFKILADAVGKTP